MWKALKIKTKKWDPKWILKLFEQLSYHYSQQVIPLLPQILTEFVWDMLHSFYDRMHQRIGTDRISHYGTRPPTYQWWQKHKMHVSNKIIVPEKNKKQTPPPPKKKTLHILYTQLLLLSSLQRKETIRVPLLIVTPLIILLSKVRPIWLFFFIYWILNKWRFLKMCSIK